MKKKKKKFLTLEEFPKKFRIEEKLTFSVESPFNSISISPEKTLFIAWHWDDPIITVNSGGTVYICRRGDLPYKFDFDVLSLRLNEKGTPEISPLYTDYHHVNEIPPFLTAQMPDDIKNKVQSYLEEVI